MYIYISIYICYFGTCIMYTSTYIMYIYIYVFIHLWTCKENNYVYIIYTYKHIYIYYIYIYIDFSQDIHGFDAVLSKLMGPQDLAALLDKAAEVRRGIFSAAFQVAPFRCACFAFHFRSWFKINVTSEDFGARSA